MIYFYRHFEIKFTIKFVKNTNIYNLFCRPKLPYMYISGILPLLPFQLSTYNSALIFLFYCRCTVKIIVTLLMYLNISITSNFLQPKKLHKIKIYCILYTRRRPTIFLSLAKTAKNLVEKSKNKN